VKLEFLHGRANREEQPALTTGDVPRPFFRRHFADPAVRFCTRGFSENPKAGTSTQAGLVESGPASPRRWPEGPHHSLPAEWSNQLCGRPLEAPRTLRHFSTSRSTRECPPKRTYAQDPNNTPGFSSGSFPSYSCLLRNYFHLSHFMPALRLVRLKEDRHARR
jgi:hypothetical protein